jgi:hypothetical protein
MHTVGHSCMRKQSTKMDEKRQWYLIEKPKDGVDLTLAAVGGGVSQTSH